PGGAGEAGGAGGAGRLFLVGRTGQLLEGWCSDARPLEIAPDLGPADQADAVAAATRLGFVCESPADVIPLPREHERRGRPIADTPELGGPGPGLLHFDPYSVTFRALARGDEDDYRTGLAFLRHGWITVSEMDALLDELLPRFTRESIAQDPAEFRRKYRGMQQMWRAESGPA
ncbi:MAG: hypothetical protein ACREMR_10165, partial [Gemmatimonadales bacterium]